MSSSQPFWIQEILNSYTTDPRAQELLTKLVVVESDDSGFTLDQGLIRYKKKIWVANNSALQTKLISAFHASAVGGHLGVKGTYHRIKTTVLLEGT